MSAPPTVAILGTRYPDLSIEEEVLAPLAARIVVGDGASDEDILAVAAGADVVIAGSRPRLSAPVVSRLGVRAIVRAGIGVDSVDLEAARRAGIWVANVPDYGTEAVAFHTVALMVAAMRRLVDGDRSLREGGWGFDRLRPLHLPASTTLGIVGFGRIGRRVSELVASLGFRAVLASDPVVTPEGRGIEPIGLADLLTRSDVVTLHAPGPPDGRPLLGEEELASMRQGSVLVNTSRGSLVDQEALATALGKGRPAVAALDVFPVEPPDLGVFEGVADRLILTPHMAWYTEESQAELRRRSAEEAARVLRGEEPLNPVVRPPREEGGA